MTITTMTSREFNQDTSRAKKAAARGPVFITDRGWPADDAISSTFWAFQSGLKTLSWRLRQRVIRRDRADFT